MEIAEAGNDCVIVGRDADVILQDWHPLRICVVAEMQSRLDRCLRYEEKQPPEATVSQKRNPRKEDKIKNSELSFCFIVCILHQQLYKVVYKL